MRLALLVLLAACVDNPLVICDNGRACPVGFVCDLAHDTCVLPTQLEACDAKDDGTRCMYPGVGAGTCAGGVCFPAVCGGGFVDAGEQCDDGNQVNGDGCSAECTREECGNGKLDVGEICDDGDLRNHDGCNSTCQPERPDWHQLALAPLDYRQHPLVGHDALRQRTVIFGGASNGITNDTWEWSQQTWSSLASLAGPSRRLAMSVAFDAERRELVLFGGLVNGTQHASDTWVFDGTRWQQRMVSGPGKRTRGAMVYDAKRKRVVLFGGFDGASMNDTWEWDGVQWAQHDSATKPSPRTPTAMEFDPIRGVTLLVGGFDPQGGPIDPNDTWTWDGTTWTRLAPATVPVGSPLAMTFDVASQRMALLTFSSSGVRYWEWNGIDWTAVPSRDLPPLQDGSRVVYDHGLGRLVAFALENGNSLAMMELASTGWITTPDPVEPPARDMTAMAYDAKRGTVMMFGGRDATSPLDDLWAWNGARWEAVAQTGMRPSPRHSHAMAFDTERGELIVVGGRTAAGRTGDTWAWDGTSWRLAGAMPPHEQMAIVYDPRGARIVAFGGTAVGFDGFDHHVAETWEWNGSGWTEIAIGGGPPARSKHAMVYDARRDRIVMFGGESEYQSFNDIWELDGTTWTQRMSAVLPPRRSGHAMAYNANRAMTMMSGGRAAAADGGGELGDTWEWDGTNWTPIATFVTPTRHADRVAAFHPGTGRVVMGGGTVAETWLYGYQGAGVPEVCGGGHDVDRDGLVGCADPDCWWKCTALCPPHTSCSAEIATCGDGTCAPLENCRLCPSDCGACTPLCGDFLCDAGETCPGDCGP